MTQKRPGFRTDEVFAVDDLTANEYATLAHLIKGDPMAAFSDPASTKGGDALAGLVMMRDRRHNAGATLGTYQARSMKELQRELGHILDPALVHELPPASADEAPTVQLLSGDVLTVGEQAASDAEDVAGEGVDPSAPPASPSSP